MLLWYCHKSEQFVDLVDDSSRENPLQNPHAILRCFLQNAGTQKLTKRCLPELICFSVGLV